MNRAKKTTCCACVVLALLATLASVTGARGLNNLPAGDRDLTDEEMAVLFGRQPVPPPCVWCQEVPTTSDCTGTNECGPCVAVGTAENEHCAADYWFYVNNDYSQMVGAAISQDPWENAWIVHTNNVPCKAQYECIEEDPQNGMACGPNGCVTANPEQKCSRCRRGDLLFPITKNNDWCEYCGD